MTSRWLLQVEGAGTQIESKLEREEITLRSSRSLSFICLLTFAVVYSTNMDGGEAWAKTRFKHGGSMVSVSQSRRTRQNRRKRGTSDTHCNEMSKSDQTDLSGTYEGSLDYPERNLSGQSSTLQITGNTFTFRDGDRDLLKGRITAVTTCRYTAVTMMFGELTAAPDPANPPAPLPALFLRACANGDNLYLTSKENDPNTGRPKFVFKHGKAALGGKGDWGRCYGSYQ